MATNDLYKELGVRRNASPATIKKAHRSLVMKYHPDVKGSGDVDRFRRIDAAYKVLRDPEKRATYDETGTYSVEAIQTEMQKVVGVMVQIYNALLESGQAFDKQVSVIDMMGKLVAQNIAQAKGSIAEAEGHIASLVDLRRTISRTDDGENLFAQTTDSHIKRKSEALDQMRDQANTLRLVEEELGNYSSFARAARAVQVVWFAGTSATTSTTG